MENLAYVHCDMPDGILLHGYVADMVESPLTGKTRLRVVDFISEAADPEAGKWIDASKCSEIDLRAGWLHNPAN